MLESTGTRIYRWEESALPPHTWTQRMLLDCDVNYPYRIVWIFSLMQRVGAAITPGRVEVRFEYLYGGVSPGRLVHRIWDSGGVGTYSVEYIPIGLVLWPGDTMEVYTRDTSTGGTILYLISLFYEVT